MTPYLALLERRALAGDTFADMPIADVLSALRALDPNGDWADVPVDEHDYCRETLCRILTDN